jgi:hypothetical protein
MNDVQNCDSYVGNLLYGVSSDLDVLSEGRREPHLMMVRALTDLLTGGLTP